MPEIPREHARAPAILSVDIGSSSVRAILYDAQGRQITGSDSRLDHALRSSNEGEATADADHLVTLTCAAIDSTLLFAKAAELEIVAVASSTFWHSLMGLDAALQPSTPVFTWADNRSGPDARALIKRADWGRLHQETGCRAHSSYWPAKLAWVRRVNPDMWERTARWVSFPDYLGQRLHGHLQTSVSLASGTGVYRVDQAGWHEDVLFALGVSSDMMAEVVDRTEPLPPLLPEFAQRWPALAAGIPWFPAVGDGAVANVGAGSFGSDRIALTIGTSGAMRTLIRDQGPERVSLPPDLWAYRLDREHLVIGGSLSNGGNVTTWMAEHLAGSDFAQIEAEAALVPADSHGLTMLPGFAGERAPSWNDDATGAITGMRLSTTAAQIYRATLEATAYRIAAVYDELRTVTDPGHEINANGGAVLKSPLWLQILADVMNAPIQAMNVEAEASARGAAVCALHSLGLIDTFVPTPPNIVETFRPHPETHERYQDGRARQERFEQALITIQEQNRNI